VPPRGTLHAVHKQRDMPARVQDEVVNYVPAIVVSIITMAPLRGGVVVVVVVVLGCGGGGGDGMIMPGGCEVTGETPREGPVVIIVARSLGGGGGGGGDVIM